MDGLGFNDTIDEDGKRKYVVYFNDIGTYMSFALCLFHVKLPQSERKFYITPHSIEKVEGEDTKNGYKNEKR